MEPWDTGGVARHLVLGDRNGSVRVAAHTVGNISQLSGGVGLHGSVCIGEVGQHFSPRLGGRVPADEIEVVCLIVGGARSQRDELSLHHVHSDRSFVFCTQRQCRPRRLRGVGGGDTEVGALCDVLVADAVDDTVGGERDVRGVEGGRRLITATRNAAQGSAFSARHIDGTKRRLVLGLCADDKLSKFGIPCHADGVALAAADLRRGGASRGRIDSVRDDLLSVCLIHISKNKFCQVSRPRDDSGVSIVVEIVVVRERAGHIYAVRDGTAGNVEANSLHCRLDGVWEESIRGDRS
mmetsp:Transcript_27233/g.64694  ORF Transcript_27233/g.64694 Transcript_27233/m.64694 type:complete len:295 (+) Transcript_27233:157-1041(+)